MTTQSPASGAGKAGLAWRALALLALAALIAAFFTPTWWVSLKAPNYPEQTFPVGIRIHFHVDGVRNGCTIRASQEVLEKEALDCVHEMDTINHFVGMYPIASGGPVEKALSPFLFSFLGILILGYIVPGDRLRLLVMGGGFAAVAVWMTLALYAPGGLNYISKGYVHALITSLGVEEEKQADENLHPIVKQLKESLAKSGIGTNTEVVAKKDSASKAELIDILRGTYENDRVRGLGTAKEEWNSTLMQAFAWHYDRSLNRWFNQPEKNDKLIAIMTVAAKFVHVAVIIAMGVFLLLAASRKSLLFWGLALVPMILPAAFIVEYSSWLWWYGHTLNEMGAFTLKPFMPTVFGQGKVAQFTTYSYPHIGFGLMAVTGLAMAASVLVRRRDPATRT